MQISDLFASALSNLLAVTLASAAAMGLWPAATHAVCPVMTGDITADSVVDVTDVQCAAIGSLAALTSAPAPDCQGDNLCSIDADCNGYLQVNDVVLTAQIALNLPLPAPIDANGDACPDVCEVSEPGDLCLACGWVGTATCQAWRWNGAACLPDAAIDCDDCNPCTVDSCVNGASCEHVPTGEGTACTDYDSCTEADQCVQGRCVGALTTSQPSPECPSTTGPACLVSGASGSTALCRLRATRVPGTSGTSALLAELRFDATKLELTGIGNSTCDPLAPADCSFAGIPGDATVTKTGHEVEYDPAAVSEWNGVGCGAGAPCNGGTACANEICAGTGGVGTILLVHPFSDSAPVSASELVGYGDGPCLDPAAGPAHVTAEPAFLTFRFLLRETIASGSPVPVIYDLVIAEGPGGAALPLRVQDELIVTQ